MKSFLLLVMLASAAFACKKQNTGGNPQWLQDKIAAMERAIQSNDKSQYKFSAWYRYEYRGKVYYQLHNPVSSLAYDLYKADGTRPDFAQTEYINYAAQRCCDKLIWKGADFNESLRTF